MSEEKQKTEEKPSAMNSKEMINEKELMIQNGLSEALLGFDPFSGSAQLSQADTLFKNNRWYLISNMRQLLSELYIEHGLVQAVVDVPVDDGMRGGIKIKTSQFDEAEINEVEALMAKEGDLQELGQAMKWTRLYGGGGLLIITDQISANPLDAKSIEGKDLDFRAVDMWELYYEKMNISDQEVDEKLQIRRRQKEFNYYNQKVHSSRVLKFEGKQAPSFIRPRLRGWGFSVVESVVRSINQYLKSTDLSFEVLDEFKLDIYRMKDLLNSLLAPDGTAKIKQRVSLANQQKNYQNAIVLDADDEYEQKQLSFAGLADTMAGIRMQIASDLRMPMTKIFGMSSAGFNAGEDDIENYNAMVEGTVREVCRYELIRMVELRFIQLYGKRPDDLEIEFEPLRVMSSEQEETVKDRQFTRVLQARQAGEISSMEFRRAINSEDLLPNKLDEDDSIDTSYTGPQVTMESGSPEDKPFQNHKDKGE